MSDNSYTTSKGVTITFRGIATLLEKIEQAYPLPKKPQYEARSATGEIHHFDHDETTLKTDEERAAWAEYLARLEERTRKHWTALVRAILLEGINYPKPTDDSWIARHRLYGIEVPDDPLEREVHYIYTECIGSVGDLNAIIAGVMDASGVSEEKIRRAEDSFRNQVGQQRRDAVAGVSAASDDAGVVSDSAFRASRSSDKDENADEPVRRAGRKR